MGLPQAESRDWYAFRIKRNPEEGDVAGFSHQWLGRQAGAPVALDSRVHSFSLRLLNGRVSATVDGREILRNLDVPQKIRGTPTEFYVGLGASQECNYPAVRYRDLEVRKLGGE
jgi:hypothetical protein